MKVPEPTQQDKSHEEKRREELLDEAFAYFFDDQYITPEQGFAEIKKSVRGWRDYYAKFVAKADKLLELLGESNES